MSNGFKLSYKEFNEHIKNYSSKITNENNLEKAESPTLVFTTDEVDFLLKILNEVEADEPTEAVMISDIKKKIEGIKN